MFDFSCLIYIQRPGHEVSPKNPPAVLRPDAGTSPLNPETLKEVDPSPRSLLHPPACHDLPRPCRISTLLQLWLWSRLRSLSLCCGDDGPRVVRSTLLDRRGCRLLGTCLIFRRILFGKDSQRWPRSMVSDRYFRWSTPVLGCLTWSDCRYGHPAPGYDGFPCGRAQQQRCGHGSAGTPLGYLWG